MTAEMKLTVEMIEALKRNGPESALMFDALCDLALTGLQAGGAAARIEALESALAELVALKKLKEEYEKLFRGTQDWPVYTEASAKKDDYLRRKPLAWQAARRLVEGKP